MADAEGMAESRWQWRYLTDYYLPRVTPAQSQNGLLLPDKAGASPSGLRSGRDCFA
jgi:hypothetical protein